MLEDSTLPIEESGADVGAGADADVGGAAAAAEPASPAPAPAPVAELSPAACAARLAELFPAVFSPGAPQPLKLRIQADIQVRAPGIFTRKALSAFLHRHTTSTAYLRALVNSPQRIDLDGAPSGEVAGEHREAATGELQRRSELHEARRAAEREAQRAAQREAQNAGREAAREAQRAERVAQRAAREAQRAQRDTERAAQDAERVAHVEAQAARAPQDEARRGRQALLRAFEASPLSRSNFCALKGMTEVELDALLAQARLESPPAPTGPAAPVRPAGPGADDRLRQSRHRPAPGGRPGRH
jgi:ProP effector